MYKALVRIPPLCLLLAMLLPFGSLAGEPQTHLPRVTLKAGLYQVDAQVAAHPQERQTGLMHRKSMPMHEGMLFVFERATIQCFWMKNTLIPLTAAFLDDDGAIVNLADMQPQSTQNHCSHKPVRYVLEMNQGWFAKRNIAPGYRLKGPMFEAN
jgi:uncharacterized membrane protein (UPF0127 family)